MTLSYWHIPQGNRAPTPSAILREQAAALYNETDGTLRGEVRTQRVDGKQMAQYLYVIVPSLDDFSLLICEYVHPISSYPGLFLDHINEKRHNVKDQPEFERRLRETLASRGVTQILDSLLDQAASGPSP